MAAEGEAERVERRHIEHRLIARRSAAATLRLQRTFAAPREAVFRAWTDPRALKAWFAPDDAFRTPVAEVDLREGGRYRIVMLAPDGERHTVHGVFREIRAPERLVFTWAWESWPPSQETLVTVELREVGSQTELTLTHERLPSVEARDKHAEGWNGCLDRLPKAL